MKCVNCEASRATHGVVGAAPSHCEKCAITINNIHSVQVLFAMENKCCTCNRSVTLWRVNQKGPWCASCAFKNVLTHSS